MELAIINGTYRDSNTKVAAAAGTVRRTCLIMLKNLLGIVFSARSGIAEIYLKMRSIYKIGFLMRDLFIIFYCNHNLPCIKMAQ